MYERDKNFADGIIQWLGGHFTGKTCTNLLPNECFPGKHQVECHGTMTDRKLDIGYNGL